MVLRAFVMLRGKDYATIRSALENSVGNRWSEVTSRTGAILESYVEVFGWADFLLTLWSPNLEIVHHAVEIVRDNTGADTTTVVGVIPGYVDSRRKAAGHRRTEKASLEKLEAREIDRIFMGYLDFQKKSLRETQRRFKQGPQSQEEKILQKQGKTEKSEK